VSRRASEVACPVCHARVGAPCAIAAGNRCVGTFHLERVRAAATQTREENLERWRKEHP
jgi:hypothetical protein